MRNIKMDMIQSPLFQQGVFRKVLKNLSPFERTSYLKEKIGS